MSRINLSYRQYILRFKSPFKTSETEITERKGFLLTFKENGVKGFGDAAPFPEFGSESFEETKKGLENFKLNLQINISDYRESLKENLKQFEKLPALRHGIEQAFLNFTCAKCNISLNELLNYESAKEIIVNGIVGLNSAEEAVQKASVLVREGFKTIKIKVGRENFNDDFRTIEQIRNNIGPDIKLRIDANCKWDVDSAIKNLKALEKFNIEYCEQPVKKVTDFLKIIKATSIPLAADESIRNYNDAKQIIIRKAASVLILKPMMIGGIIPGMEIAEFAKRYNIKTVITSSFESPVGKSFAILAASFLKSDIAHGLATSELFETDLHDPYPVKNGVIKLG